LLELCVVPNPYVVQRSTVYIFISIEADKSAFKSALIKKKKRQIQLSGIYQWVRNVASSPNVLCVYLTGKV